MKTLWIIPETAGGIRTYAETLFLELENEARALWHLPSEHDLREAPEKLIHLQHEFGLFGSKVPGFYRFPAWILNARRAAGARKWVVTAHTVLDSAWNYPRSIGVLGGLKTFLLNRIVVPFARESWGKGTWGDFDGVIVHSALQLDALRNAGAKRTVVIPHFVPRLEKFSEPVAARARVLLFGYFSLEKGQDLAIRAWREFGTEGPKLILAGGVRRPEDRSYFEECRTLIRRFGLEDAIEITGFVPASKTAELYRDATLVLAPFRATSGSGSLATAFGHGAAVLASDLPINREVQTRVPGCLAVFPAGDPVGLAKEVRALLGDRERRDGLRESARIYAEIFSPEKVAQLHRDFYEMVHKS